MRLIICLLSITSFQYTMYKAKPRPRNVANRKVTRAHQDSRSASIGRWRSAEREMRLARSQPFTQTEVEWAPQIDKRKDKRKRQKKRLLRVPTAAETLGFQFHCLFLVFVFICLHYMPLHCINCMMYYKVLPKGATSKLSMDKIFSFLFFFPFLFLKEEEEEEQNAASTACTDSSKEKQRRRRRKLNKN